MTEQIDLFKAADKDEGRRVPDADYRSNDEVTIGAPGVAIHGGMIMTEEKDSRLNGRDKYLTYGNLLANNPIVAAGVRYFLNISSGANWKVQVKPENEGNAKAEEIAEKIELVMHSMRTPWHRVIRRAVMFRFYGFSLQEWTAKALEDGTIGFDDIAPRAQSTIEKWDTDRTGKVLGVSQRSPQTGSDIDIPRKRLLYFVDDSLHDSPEGLGIFRHLVKLDARLQRYEILEGWGFERDLRGTPIGRLPLSELQKLVEQEKLTEAEAAAIKLPLETFISNAMKGKDTGLTLDSAVYKGTGENNQPTSNEQWGIELLKGETTSQEEMAVAIERINREIARLLGVEQLLLGSDSRGSHALSQDKTQAFGVVIDSALQEVAKTLEPDFLEVLADLNGWDKELLPTFRIEKAQFREVGDVVSALKDMALAGAPLPVNDPAINEIRRMLGLSDQEEQDEELAIALEELPLVQQEQSEKQQADQAKIALEAAKNPAPVVAPGGKPGQPGPKPGAKPKPGADPKAPSPGSEPRTGSDLR